MIKTMTTSAPTMMLGLSLLLGGSAFAGPPTQPAGKLNNGWNAKPFDYDKPSPLVVEESTPTEAQLSWVGRPPQMKADEPAPADKGRARPKVVAGMNIVR